MTLGQKTVIREYSGSLTGAQICSEPGLSFLFPSKYLIKKWHKYMLEFQAYTISWPKNARLPFILWLFFLNSSHGFVYFRSSAVNGCESLSIDTGKNKMNVALSLSGPLNQPVMSLWHKLSSSMRRVLVPSVNTRGV